MDELLKQIQEYIKAYKELPYGKEVEGTTEILEKSSQTLIKTAHRVVLLENQFIDGMKVKYQGDDEMDGIECPICKYEVARMMIIQKCVRNIVQNAEQNLFIRIQ